MRTYFSLFLALLLFTGGFCSLFTRLARAEISDLPTVHIWSDGSVEPSTAPIQRNGDIYTFTGNFSSQLIVEKSDVLIDGNGFQFIGDRNRNVGNRGTAVYVKGLTNITVRGTGISDYRYGIYFENSSYNIIENNKLSNVGDGIVFDHWSSGNSITRNNLTAISYNAMFLGNTSYNVIAENTVTNSGKILDSYNTSYNQIINNRLSKGPGPNAGGIILRGGDYDASSDNNTVYGNMGAYSLAIASGDNNTVYENNGEQLVVDGAANSVFENNFERIFIGGENSTLHKNRMNYLSIGGDDNIITQNYIEDEGEKAIGLEDYSKAIVYAEHTGSSIISHNIIIARSMNGVIVDAGTISENYIEANEAAGVIIPWGRSGRVIGNTIVNSARGVYLRDASRCTVTQNLITGNEYGIFIYSSSNSTISGNNITSNNQGIYSQGETYEGKTTFSARNNITSNLISKCTDTAIYLNSSSRENNVYNNSIINNKVGIRIGDDSSLNTIYNNNFIANELQAEAFPWREYWNSTYSQGGNYWSNYTGIDTNADGFGDTPHILDLNNQDNYPLASPATIPNPDTPSAPPPTATPKPTPAVPEITSIYALAVLIAASCIFALKKKGKNV